MNEFKAKDLLLLLWQLLEQKQFCERAVDTGTPGYKFHPEQYSSIISMLSKLQNFCDLIKLTNAAQKISFSIGELETSDRLHPASLATELRTSHEAIIADCDRHRFVQVYEDRIKYFNDPALFGQSVLSAFPDASFNIQEAGNCLAVECNTAAVYHLMCAVEIALRVLAWDRRIAFKKGTVETQEWGKILGKLEDAVKDIKNWPQSLSRESAHQFYNTALIECRSFNDAYRRHLAHARVQYDRNQALSVMEHVSIFMGLLATKISQKKRTPLRWKRA